MEKDETKEEVIAVDCARNMEAFPGFSKASGVTFIGQCLGTA